MTETQVRRSRALLTALAFALALAITPGLALADQVSGTSPVSVPDDAAASSHVDDDLVPDAPASSPADVLGAQGAPAECPLDEDAAAPADGLPGEAPEDAETREEPAAEIPGCENDPVTPAADDEAEAEEDAGAADASAAMDDVDGSGDSQGGHSAAAPSAARTSACESPETATDEPFEEPLLLEAKTRIVAGWNKVGGKYYWHDSASSAAKRGWLVTGQLPTGGSGGLQRYWLGEGGALAVSTLVDASDAGWWAYARPEGYVVRGKYVSSNGNVYLANNDGRLESPGWLVTNKYGDGLQRYYVDSKAHAAVPGYSADGWDHYTMPEKGYVARGKHVAPDGNVYLANNDGRLEKPGWLVTNKYDGSMQRYWIDAKAHAAVPGYSKDGWAHYTLPGKGYVARGSFVDSAGRTKQADNDGRVKGGIPKPRNGWVVSSDFGHGLQRYWFRNDVMATSELLTASETGWWAYARPEGYVVRGKYVAKDGNVYLANNDGRLENPGWLVTSKYGDGLQRYYIDSEAHAAVPGYSEDGWAHFTLPDAGYVARNQHHYIGSTWYKADNDGRLVGDKPALADRIEKYLSWAIGIANDDSHGYSIPNRWGPDYDCSSLVVSALKAAGLKVGSAFWTGNMQSELTKYGWTWIPDVSQRRRGDILLYHDPSLGYGGDGHTEMYLGNNQNVGAHIDENGSIGYGAKSGDQTGHEIDVGKYWNPGWDGVLRLTKVV